MNNTDREKAFQELIDLLDQTSVEYRWKLINSIFKYAEAREKEALAIYTKVAAA